MTEAISIKDIYVGLKNIEENMVTKQEFETLIDTIEILSNQETMKQIEGSMQDIKTGKVKKINSVKDLISEM